MQTTGKLGMSICRMQRTLVDGSHGGKTQIVAYLRSTEEGSLVKIQTDSKLHA